jgi:hypothetical protein
MSLIEETNCPQKAFNPVIKSTVLEEKWLPRIGDLIAVRRAVPPNA